MKNPLDDLDAFLAEVVPVKRSAGRPPKSPRRISQDYADGLVRKAKLRALLAANDLDGERFRFYFRGHALDSLRAKIDLEILKESVKCSSATSSATQTGRTSGASPCQGKGPSKA